MTWPDGANRRQPSSFRERVGEAGVTGFTAAGAHLERSGRKRVKAPAKIRLQHIVLVGVLFAVSVGVTFASCPFAGPATGELFLFMLGWVLVSHLLAGIVSLFLRKFTLISALFLGLICLLPASFFAGHAIKDNIYLRHYAVWDRFRDELANPIPKSVSHLRFNTIEEDINPDLSFRFSIEPKDLQEIIRVKRLKLVRPDDLRCPQDYFKYPYYLPVRGSFVLYQGVDKAGSVLTLKVNEAHEQAIFRKESEAYYKHRYWEANPTLVKMGQEDLARLSKRWEAEPSGPANGSQPIRSETNRTSPAAGSGR